MPRHTRTTDPLRQDHHWWHRFKFSTQKFAVVLSVLAVVSGFGYVFLTNHTAQEGFAIKKLQQQISEVQASNQRLELRAADLRSLASVEATSTQLGLVPTDTFTYVAPTSGAVAAR
jgi:hypothetical protein